MTTLCLTSQGFARTVRDFRAIAGENGTVEFISGCFYFFGTELATLRLLSKYRACEKARQGFSSNRGTHYFALETSFSGSMTAPAEDGEVTLNPGDPLALLRRADVAIGAMLRASAINPRAVRERPDCAEAESLADSAVADIRVKLAALGLRTSAPADARRRVAVHRHETHRSLREVRHRAGRKGAPRGQHVHRARENHRR